MKIRIEIDEKRLRELILSELTNQLGEAAPQDLKDIEIQVKSKQNYKSEWEKADFRAVYERNA